MVDIPNVGVEGNGQVTRHHATQPVVVELLQSLLMTLVSPNYTDRSHRDRTALETAVQRALNNASIKKIKTQSFLLTLHPDTAESQLSVVVHLNNDSRYAAAGSVVFVEMELEFEKIGRKWYIRRADVVSINKNPMGWRDIS